MTKIKNFRISPRLREIARWLKKERGTETTPDLELTIEQVVKESKSWISPAAIYTTLTRQIAEKTTTIPFPDKAIAVSIVAISIGPALAEHKRVAEPDAARHSLLSAIEQEALSQTMQFAIRLVQEQAKDEDCEMSSPVSAQDPQLAVSLATLLGVHRIGLSQEAAVSELPPFARVSWLFWTPVGKGTSRRAEPAGRAEKVAV